MIGNTENVSLSTSLRSDGGNGYQLKAKSDLDSLERERRETERRRQRSLDRTNRILHAKTRIIGIDKKSLDDQVKEKQEREKKDSDRDRQYDEMQLNNTKTLTELEREKQRNQAQRDGEVATFLELQKKDKKKRETLQANSVDPMTASSTVFLDFAGVDANKITRDTEQKQQQQDWLTHQVIQLTEKEARQKQEEKEYADEQRQRLELHQKLTNEAEIQKTIRLKEMQAYNLQQAADKKSSLRRSQQNQQFHNELDMDAQLKSQILNEQYGDKTVSYQFKGFNQAQRQAILDEQKRQQQEMEAKRLKDKNDQEEYERQQEEIRRETVRQQRLRAEAEQKARTELKNTHLVQKKEQDLKTRHLNKVVYTNPVAPEYFEQFGKSDR